MEGYNHRLNVPEEDKKRLEELRTTLTNWCARNGHEAGPLSFDDVVRTLAKSRELRKEVRSYLSDGPIFQLDPEVAVMKREQIAWSIIDALESD